MKKRLIDLHNQWMKTGLLNYSGSSFGLCNTIPNEYRETLSLFIPDIYQLRELYDAGIIDTTKFDFAYWAEDCKPFELPFPETNGNIYGPTRQAIVLLICAMHNEL